MAGKRKSIFRAVTGWLHLWLGLISGIIVFIVSLTGCLFVFQQEITEWRYEEMMRIKPAIGGIADTLNSVAGDSALRNTLPFEQLMLAAQNALGKDQPVNAVNMWKDDARAWEFMAYKDNDSAVWYSGVMVYFRSVFVNPYSGEVTGILNYKADFFQIVKYLHWSLLLNTKYGQPIVGWATFIFVILLISGVVLWWPKKWNRATRQASFGILWKARFKRLNYDLHNVLGFWLVIPSVILGLTGLVFAFTWFQSLTYTAASGSTTPPPVRAPVVSADSSIRPFGGPLTAARINAIAAYPEYERLSFYPVADASLPTTVYGYPDAETYYGFRQMEFDGYSGRLLRQQQAGERNRGERLIEMNYDIHVGAVAGLTGKILAFIASLVCTSLPVTGFLVWWNKRKKVSLRKQPAVS